MPYALTLTHEERKAIDWVGHRYAHGDELREILDACDTVSDDDCSWGGDEELTFVIPEHKAWDIQSIGEESNWRWDCFSPGLVSKLNRFCAGVI